MHRDYPLKLIIEDNPTVFCRDFLGLDIKSAKPVTKELKSRVRHVDILLELTLPDDSLELSHIELQAPGSAMPMAKRMLDYFSLAGQQYHHLYPNIEDLPLRSYVIYLDKGTGKKDTGSYRLGKFHTGHFSYTVIRLWEISAQRLINLEQPVLLTLIGQSKLNNPQQEIQQAMVRINQVKDKEKAGHLFALMGALIEDKELTKMVENYASNNEFFKRSPLLQDMHRQGWDEGMLEGEKKGFAEGRQVQQRESIREVFLERFDVKWSRGKKVIALIEQLPAESLTEALLKAATVEKPELFEDWLEQHALEGTQIKK